MHGNVICIEVRVNQKTGQLWVRALLEVGANCREIFKAENRQMVWKNSGHGCGRFSLQH